MYPTVLSNQPVSCRCCQFQNDLFLPNQKRRQPVHEPAPPAPPSATASDGVPTSVPPNVDDDNEATVPNPNHHDESTIIVDPIVAWQQLLRRTKRRTVPTTDDDDDDNNNNNNNNQPVQLLLVDTHSHAHLKRRIDDGSNSNHIYSFPNKQQGLLVNDIDDDIDDDDIDDECRIAVMSCAVDRSDWERCLKYAAKSKFRIPALGIHPWYVESVVSSIDITNTNTDRSSSSSDTGTTECHSSRWLEQLEQLLQQHPGCMVGEIGLCKVARFVRTYAGGKSAALHIQRTVFTNQLRLAAKYNRPVSIHCVNQHGVLIEIFQQLHDDQIPPAMALHSYTGTVRHMQTLLQWEQRFRSRCQENKSISIEPPPLLYFGISHSVNYVMCTSTKSKRQGMETIRSIPHNRLLVESDVHCTNHVTLGTVATVAYVAHVRNESLEQVAAQTTQNGLRFFSTIASSVSTDERK